jgi:ABC-type lipoprotein release transport system permease subunit
VNLNKLVYIVGGNLRERKGRTFTAVFVIAFAVAVVMFILSLSLGFLRGVVKKAEVAYPPGMLVVKPKTVSVAMLSVNATTITDAVVDNIRRLPGVEFVAPQLSLKMPMRAEADILGQSAESDAFVLGVAPVIVEKDVARGFKFQYSPGDSNAVPCVVPRYFLDMYNLAYSESMGLPKVNEGFAIGKHVKLSLGESYTMGDAGGKHKDIQLQIVGLTPNPNFVGVLIPLRNAMDLNQWYTGSKTFSYTALHVKLKSLGSADEVIRLIEGMQLNVQSQKDVFEKFQFVARSLGVLTAIFGVIVVAIAAVSIFNTFSLIMVQRRGEVGLLRAVGGTRRMVTALYIIESAVIGIAGGVLGMAVSALILSFADARILAHLPHVSFLPEHLFVISGPLMFASFAGGIFLSLVPTVPIILKTTRQSPVSLITES